jgi:hypothetical protein
MNRKVGRAGEKGRRSRSWRAGSERRANWMDGGHDTKGGRASRTHRVCDMAVVAVVRERQGGREEGRKGGRYDAWRCQQCGRCSAMSDYCRHLQHYCCTAAIQDGPWICRWRGGSWSPWADRDTRGGAPLLQAEEQCHRPQRVL